MLLILTAALTFRLGRRAGVLSYVISTFSVPCLATYCLVVCALAVKPDHFQWDLKPHLSIGISLRVHNVGM